MSLKSTEMRASCPPPQLCKAGGWPSLLRAWPSPPPSLETQQKARKQLSPVASASGTKESCLPAWEQCLPSLQIPDQKQQPTTPLTYLPWVPLPPLCHLFPDTPCPLGLPAIAGYGVGGRVEAETLRQAQEGSGSPRRRPWAITVSLVQALGLGLRECSPRHSG